LEKVGVIGVDEVEAPEDSRECDVSNLNGDTGPDIASTGIVEDRVFDGGNGGNLLKL
jgi:hypothetical protein